MLRTGVVTLAVAFAVLGFLISTQYKIQRRLAAAPVISRDVEAARRLVSAEQDRNRLQEEVSQLRQQVSDIGKQQGAVAGLSKALQDAQDWAGLTELHGTGVSVSMFDSNAPRKPGENPDQLIMHDEDILQVVNELFASGAEAISINGQRLVARSEIRIVGAAVVINGIRTAPPLLIRAIGNPDVLDAGLHLRGGIADKLVYYGLPPLAVRKEKDIAVPPFKGSLHWDFAQPGTGGS